MKKRMSRFLIILGVFTIAAASSCSVNKFIPEDEQLYTGGEVEMISDFKIRDEKEVESELNGLLRPEPNSKILGIRFGLWAHYKGNQENPGFINRFLNNKFGEEPVYMSDVDVAKTEDLIFNRLENRGFFYSTVESEVADRGKFASTYYAATLTEPYLLEKYGID